MSKITLTLDDYYRRVLKPMFINHIKSGSLDVAIEKMPIEEIYMLDNESKDAVLDRLKVIDGMDLPRVVGNVK